MSLNPNLDLYVIAVALSAIFLNFSNDFLPYIVRIPAIILALVIIAAVLCSISIAKYIKIRTISLSKNCEKTNVNTLIIGRNKEMSGIEVIPVEIGAMTLREQNLFTSHADVELVATSVDPDRTQLKVHGRLRPPVASTPEPIDPEVVERLSQVVIRSLLRRIARATEEAAVSSHAPTKPRRSRSTAGSSSANGTKNGTGTRRGRATTEGTTAGAVRA